MDFEPMDDFEQELRQALERRPAPPSLKRRLMGQRLERLGPGKPALEKRELDKRRAPWSLHNAFVWQRLAAALVLVAVLGGAAEWGWHEREERRKGEAAREQVLTALRITNHALNQVNSQLAAHNRTTEE